MGLGFTGLCSFRPCPVRSGPGSRCVAPPRLDGAAGPPPTSSAARLDPSSPRSAPSPQEVLTQKQTPLTHFPCLCATAVALSLF